MLPDGATAMPVGLSGSGMEPPACRVTGLIAVSERLAKFPTSTSPAATAIACGPGPTGMAAPACMVETSIGVTALLPKSATNAVAAPVVATKTAMATGWLPTVTGGPARHEPRSTGVTVFESRLATRAMPLPPVPPGATATASGSTPTSARVHHGVGRRVDLVQHGRPPGSRPAGPPPPGV